jgi:hypothetical protein
MRLRLLTGLSFLSHIGMMPRAIWFFGVTNITTALGPNYNRPSSILDGLKVIPLGIIGIGCRV